MQWHLDGDVIRFLPLGIAGILSWSIWIWRRVLSHRAPAIDAEFSSTVSLVVPVYGEDPVIFAKCLDTWIAAQPDEIILVVDTNSADVLRMLSTRTLPPFVRIIEFEHQGKRSALGVGVRAARFEIVVFADSDTAWQPELLTELLRGFADPAVGGVGTRQLVAGVEVSVWRRVASWLLDIRFLDYVPAMGAAGAVACLSGRTAGYRRSAIEPLMPQLEHEIFLGRECIAGDDGRLTWLTLAAGYKTVHQRSAIAHSMFPVTTRAFVRQRIRWSRNSYRCYLTAIVKGWLWRQPLVTQVTVLQILLTPLTMGLALVFLYFAVTTHGPLIAAAFIAWVFVGRLLRGLSHLQRVPRDVVLLPLIVATTIVIALPIKLFSLVTMNCQGWLTREATSVGGEGQDLASMRGEEMMT